MSATRHFLLLRHASAIRAADEKGITERLIFDPPCECIDCHHSYLDRRLQKIDIFSYAGSLSNSQAQDILDGYITQITNDRIYLKEAIDDYGDTILHDWENRSQSERRALLMDTNPTLADKTPAHVHLEYAGTTVAEHKQKHRNTNLVPYLDVQRLSKEPGPVISLLENRVWWSPEEWAPYDNEQLHTAWNSGLITVQFNKDGVKIFGSEYGKLVPWDAEAAHRGDLIGFPRARLLLEAQAYIMSFLRKIVEKILDNSNMESLSGSIKWCRFIFTGRSSNVDQLYWSRFALDPFSSPKAFDIGDLLTLAEARLNAKADHVEFLQTEPAYMRRYAEIYGRTRSARRHKDNALEFKALNDGILSDINHHRLWREICGILKHLSERYHDYQPHISRGKSLPSEMDYALGKLETTFYNCARLCSSRLISLVERRPEFKRWKDYLPCDYKTQISGCHLGGSTKIDQIFTQDPLWWSLMQLRGDPDDYTLIPYSTLFEFLDAHLASTNSKERSRLDETLFDALSELATFLNMLRAIRMHYPKSFKRNEVMIYEMKNSVESMSKEIDTAALGRCLSDFMKIALPNGPQNAKWLANLTRSHVALQKYWKSVHDYYVVRNRLKGFSEQKSRDILQMIEVWSSDKYRSLLSAKQESISHEISLKKRAKNPNNDTFLPLPKVPNNQVYIPLPNGPDLPTRPKLPEPRVKEKTRGITDISPAPATDAPAQDVERPVTMTLTKRSMKTFSSIFPITHEERSRTVPWEAFVGSMEEAGFKARSGGGSIVIFEKADGGGRINFHRPHPDPTLDPVMLQTIGRRMNKWFGWTRDIFKLAAN